MLPYYAVCSFFKVLMLYSLTTLQTTGDYLFGFADVVSGEEAETLEAIK